MLVPCKNPAGQVGAIQGDLNLGHLKQFRHGPRSHLSAAAAVVAAAVSAIDPATAAVAGHAAAIAAAVNAVVREVTFGSFGCVLGVSCVKLK